MVHSTRRRRYENRTSPILFFAHTSHFAKVTYYLRNKTTSYESENNSCRDFYYILIFFLHWRSLNIYSYMNCSPLKAHKVSAYAVLYSVRDSHLKYVSDIYFLNY